MSDGSLQIGETATHSGVSVDTVRYYERLSLLPRAVSILTADEFPVDAPTISRRTRLNSRSSESSIKNGKL